MLNIRLITHFCQRTEFFGELTETQKFTKIIKEKRNGMETTQTGRF